MSLTATSKVTALALCCGVLSGCATTDGNQQLLGAGIGTALGCGIGYAIGGDVGCAVGGALGAAAGWGVVAQYQATQVRSAAQDQQLYGVTEPVTTTQVQIRKATADPASIKRGGTVQVTTDYSLMLPRSMKAQGTDVQESWVLKKDGKVLLNVAPKNNHHPEGGWNGVQDFPVPGNAEPGTYVVESKVQVGTSYDTVESAFVVES
ncbi:MAG: hypothetical protein ACT4QB_01095 [Gammaproteobacteria bacterium]